MSGVNSLTLWVLTGLVAVTTISFNLYMFLMTLLSKKGAKERSPSETIIMALAAADVTHQIVCYFWMTMNEADIDCHITQMFYTTLLLLIFSFRFTIIWDTSFLTFYYSTKLVSTPNHCYTQIQAAILKHVTATILLIPLLGLATTMPILIWFHVDDNNNHTELHGDIVDCGVLVPNSSAGRIYNIVFLLLTDVLPGTIMLKCCISISVHLAIHLRHMRASTNGAHPPKLGSQLRVVQMSLSLVANFIVFLVVDLYVNYTLMEEHESTIGVTFFVMSVHTTVTAALLIYGKKTLWKNMIRDFNTCLDVFPCLSCLKTQKASPEAAPEAKH